MNIYYHKSIGIDVISFWKSILGVVKGLVIPIILGIIIMNYIIIDSIMEFCLWIFVYVVIYMFSVVLLGITPFLFDTAYDIQELVIGEKIKMKRVCF